MRWIKLFFLALVTCGFAWFGLKDLAIEQDILRALSPLDASLGEVFRYFEKSGIYKDKLFLVKERELDEPNAGELSELLVKAGYERYMPPLFAGGDISRLALLYPFFFAEDVAYLLHADYLDLRADEIAQALELPGGGSLFTSKDPLGLAGESLRFLGKRLKGPLGQSAVAIYQRKGPLDYARVGDLYDFLLKQREKMHFLGGDLFAMENYRAIQEDIQWVVWVSLVLNLALFFWFCPHPRLLLFFAAGTFVSYVCGIGVLRLFYPYVYALVLVFTSTFVGFNNEYLVHFSGINRVDLGRTLLGLGSAIGTTLIGFIVLLFAQNPIIKQIALVSLGGMLGFVLLMASYQGTLSKVTYRTFNLPHIMLKKSSLFGCWAVLIVLLGWFGHAGFHTDINDFRFTSPELSQQSAFFSKILDGYSMGSMVALPCGPEDFSSCFDRALAAGANPLAFHPMALYRNKAQQLEIAQKIALAQRKAAGELTKRLEQRGVFVVFDPPGAQGYAPLDAQGFLALFNDISFFPFSYTEGGHAYLFVAQGKGVIPGAVPMSPQLYYNRVLTELQDNMAWLFGAGLLAMLVYLLPLQRKLINIMYIYLPLGVALLVLLAITRLQGGINFIHITGLALLIAITLDYSCILISNRFIPLQQSKVVLTGLSSVLTFGLLAFCRHPVMRDLGLTVGIGSAVALAVAVFTRVET